MILIVHKTFCWKNMPHYILIKSIYLSISKECFLLNKKLRIKKKVFVWYKKKTAKFMFFPEKKVQKL